MEIITENRKGYLRQEVKKTIKASGWNVSLYHPNPMYRTLGENCQVTNLWLRLITDLARHQLSQHEKELILHWCRCAVCNAMQSESAIEPTKAPEPTKRNRRKRTAAEIRLGLPIASVEGVA